MPATTCILLQVCPCCTLLNRLSPYKPSAAVDVGVVCLTVVITENAANDRFSSV